MKVALRKDENEETQKEVEMAILALSGISKYDKVSKELYLTEIKEIVQYHQEHNNLTQLAYQSAWQFLIFRLPDKSLEGIILNDLHFIREASKEFKMLGKCVDWNQMEGKLKETKEVKILWRWTFIFEELLYNFQVWTLEVIGLIHCFVSLCRASRENEREIFETYFTFFLTIPDHTIESVHSMLKEGAVDMFIEEILRSTSEDKISLNCLELFLVFTKKLKRKADIEAEEGKRKSTKMKIFKMMEEEGYEDIITSFYETFSLFNKDYFGDLSLNISEYFVNI